MASKSWKNEGWGILSNKILLFSTKNVVLGVEGVSLGSQSFLRTQNGTNLVLYLWFPQHALTLQPLGENLSTPHRLHHLIPRLGSRCTCCLPASPPPHPSSRRRMRWSWKAPPPPLQICRVEGLVTSSPLSNSSSLSSTGEMQGSLVIKSKGSQVSSALNIYASGFLPIKRR